MSKVIVTLKEPIRVDGDMKTILEFDYAQPSWDHKPMIYFGNAGERSDCPIPIDNILGVSYKKDAEKPVEKTFQLGANANEA